MATPILAAAEAVHRQAMQRIALAGPPPYRGPVLVSIDKHTGIGTLSDGTRVGPETARRMYVEGRVTGRSHLGSGSQAEAAFGAANTPWLGKIPGQLVTAAEGIPAGLYQLGKAPTMDVKDLVVHGRAPGGHTLDLAKAVGSSVAEDFRHGSDRPGFLLLDLLGAASMGLGAPARLGAVGAVLREGGALAPLRAASRLALGPKPSYMELSKPGGIAEHVDPLSGETSLEQLPDWTVERRLSPNMLARKLPLVGQEARLGRLQARLLEPPREFPEALGGLPGPVQRLLGPLSPLLNKREELLGANARFGRDVRAQRRTDELAAGEPSRRLSHLASRLPEGAQTLINTISFHGDEAAGDPLTVLRRQRDLYGRQAAIAETPLEATRHLELVAGLDKAIRFAEDRHAGRLSGKTADRFEKALAESERLSTERKQQLIASEDLTPESAGFREAAPAAAEAYTARLQPLREQEVRLRRQIEAADATGTVLPDEFYGQHARAARELADKERLGPFGREVVSAAPGRLQGEDAFARASQSQRHLDRIDKSVAGVEQKVAEEAARTRPRNYAEAEKFVADVDQEYRMRLAKFALRRGHEEPVTAKEIRDPFTRLGDPREQAHRNRTNWLINEALKGRRHPGQAAALRHGGYQQTAKQEMAAEVERQFRDALHRADFPALQEFKQRLAEADKVSAGLEELRSVQTRTAGLTESEQFDRVFGGEHPSFLEAAAAAREGRVPPPSSTQRAENLGTVGPARPEELARRQALLERFSGERVHHEKILAKQQARLDKEPFAQNVQWRKVVERKVVENPERLAAITGTILPELGHRLSSLQALIETAAGDEKGPLRRMERELRRQQKAWLAEAAALKEPIPRVPGAFRAGPLTGGEPPASPGPAFQPPSVGAYGVTERPAGRTDASLTHQVTGKSIEMGSFRYDGARLSAESHMKAMRIGAAMDGYEHVFNASSKLRTSRFDIPVPDPARIKPELRRFLEAPREGKALTADDIAAVSDETAMYLEKELHLWDRETKTFRFEKDGPAYSLDQIPVGEGSDFTRLGVRWIDRRVFEALREAPQPVRSDYNLASMVNNVGRIAYVYAKLSYILNLPGNIGMQAITQGMFAPMNMRAAWKLRGTLVKHLGEERGNRIADISEGLVGEGKARAFSVGTGWLGGGTDKLATFWSRLVDRNSRISALVHEARKEGLVHGFADLTADDAERFAQMIETPSMRRSSIRRAANKSLVEFDNMTDVERNYLRHWLFVYPWVRGATLWSIKTMIEQPGKTVTLAHLSDVGAQRADDSGLKLPSYMLQRGVFPVSLHGDKAMLVDPSALSTWGTATNNARLIESLLVKPATGHLTARDAASPALELLIGSLTGTSAGGRDYNDGSLIGALKDVYKGTPYYGYLREAGLVDQPSPDRPDYQQPIYQQRGPLGVLAHAVGGGVVPRPSSVSVANAKAEREYRLSLGPVDRFKADASALRTSLLDGGRKTGLLRGGRLTPTMEQAYRLWNERRIAYAQEAEKRGIPASKLNLQDRLRIDLRLAVFHHRVQPGFAQGVERALPTMPETEIKRLRRGLHDQGFGQALLSGYMRALRSRGIDVQWPN